MAAPSRTSPALWSLGPIGLVVGLVIGRWSGLGGGPERTWQPSAPASVAGVVGAPSLAPVVERASRAVVAVNAMFPDGPLAAAAPVRGPGEAPPSLQARSSGGVRNGSGFVVHRDGLIVTARHVVAGAASIRVQFQDREPGRAELVGEDAVTDLAVIRLIEPPGDLAVLQLGRSENLRAGDWIVAIGNPFGYAQTVTAGVVSFVGRHLANAGFGVTTDFLQFSAAVHRGSSGCPVLDLDGAVVGVTTQAADDAQGISFAIPARTVKWVLDALDHSADGRVRRGYLGVELGTRLGRDEAGRPLAGALVLGVAEGGPAARAGLQRGDVIVDLGGQAVLDAADMHERVTRSTPGSSLRLAVLRQDRAPVPMQVTVGEVGSSRDSDPTH